MESISRDLMTAREDRTGQRSRIPPQLLARHVAATFVLVLPWWLDGSPACPPPRPTSCFVPWFYRRGRPRANEGGMSSAGSLTAGSEDRPSHPWAACRLTRRATALACWNSAACGVRGGSPAALRRDGGRHGLPRRCRGSQHGDRPLSITRASRPRYTSRHQRTTTASRRTSTRRPDSP